MSHNFKDLKRLEQVISTMLSYEFGFWLSKMHLVKKRKDGFPIPSTEPIVIRKIMEELGGTFVKLGQLLSLRPDLIPPKYSEEFSNLQDNVKPFPRAQAIELIEESLGIKTKEVFTEIPKIPIASASIGQVYKAKLHNGTYVALKVQRPNIRDTIESDLEILAFFAKELKKHMNNKIMDPQVVVEELKNYTLKELNYLNELQNLEKFNATLPQGLIRVPRVYRDFSSDKVLVMEFLEGVKLKDYMKKKLSPKERTELADLLANSYFQQMFVTGFIHADPHPGNIIVLDEKKYPNQKIGLIDFGIVGKVDDSIKNGMLKMFLSLINKDLEGLVDSMVDLHLLKEKNNALMNDVRDVLGPYYNVSFDKIDLPKLFMQSLNFARRYNVEIPRDYVLVGKALVTIQSVCININPKFNLVESSKDFVTGMMLKKYSPKFILGKGIDKTKDVFSELMNFPKVVKNHFENEEQQKLYLKKISENIDGLEKEIDVVSERFFIMMSGIAFFVAAFFFKDQAPLIDGGLSIFSIVFVLLGIGFFFSAIFKKRHKN